MTFLASIWKPLNLERGHLTIPKRSQRIARYRVLSPSQVVGNDGMGFLNHQQYLFWRLSIQPTIHRAHRAWCSIIWTFTAANGSWGVRSSISFKICWHFVIFIAWGVLSASPLPDLPDPTRLDFGKGHDLALRNGKNHCNKNHCWANGGWSCPEPSWTFRHYRPSHMPTRWL